MCVVYTGEQKREYQRQWLAARRQKAIEMLGGCCVNCRSQDRLEFDHIDPATKAIDLARLWSHKWEKIHIELAKCQLLCFTCHKEKTLAVYPDRVHGSYLMYNKGKCRCKPCKDANAERTKEYNSR